MNQSIENGQHLPLHGLCTDSPLEQTPEGALSFALNYLNDSEIGDQGALVSEGANKLCVSFPQGFVERGSCSISPTEVVKFGYIIYNNTLLKSYIYLVNLEDCTYEVKLDSSCANFSDPITAEFKVIKGCERVIIWRQDNQPDYYLNLDKVVELNPDCNTLRLNPDISVPTISLEGVNDTGGYLPIGTYAVQVEYLTGNQEVIYRSYISPTVPIIDDPLNLAYNSIDGGLNIDTNLADVGGVPITTKSITFGLSGLDTRFPYYRINVVRYISSDGLTPSTHQVATLFPINSTFGTFTYTGFNPANGDTLIDYAQINVPVTRYEASKALEQVQNRLLRGNVKENSRDYSGYQRVVNDITSKPVIGQVAIDDQFSRGDSKNPNTYFEKVGYQSDEIYPFGIVFVHSNGDESPVFPTIGRSSNAFDTELLTVGTDIDETETRHLGISNGEEVERWKVFNTGSSLQFAYHESEGLYPEATDCNGDKIFGPLAGQKVRHHRFPSRKEISLVDGTNLNILGIEFENIQYPDTDIVGHYFVRGKRDSLNRTVLDSGYLIPCLEGTPALPVVSYRTLDNQYALSQNVLTSLVQTQTKNWVFWNPYTSFTSNYLNGSYFTLHESLTNTSVVAEDFTSFPDGWDFFTKYLFDFDRVGVDFTNRAYDGNIIVRQNTIQPQVGTFPQNIFNSSKSNALNFYHTRDDLETGGADWYGYYATNKRVADVFSNILSINYYRTHSGTLTGISSQIYGGDTFISKHNLYDIYGVIGKDVSVDFAGNLFVESEINCGLRLHGTFECNTYFNGVVEEQGMANHALSKVSSFSETDTENKPRQTTCPEFYRINPDLNRLQYDTNYQTLGLTYDYCSKCRTQFKNRIIFSEKSFQDDLGDNYRTFLANNYIDLPSNRGEIVSMTYRNQKLLVRCTDGLFVLFPNPQKLQTDENSVYIGTGDFLTLPENEIMSSDSGYAGQQCILAETGTPYGVCWADQNRGKIFLFDDNLEEISRYKMYHWFSRNLKPFLKEDLKPYGIPYNPDEFGLRMTYDPKFERIIVHKKDFKLTSTLKRLWDGLSDYEIQVLPDRIILDGNSYEFINTDYFENKSWTISYSIRTKTWTSWHSYQPDYLCYGANTFYSSLGNQVWSHDDYTRFHEYFGKQFPAILEFVDRQYLTNNLHSIHYWATAHSYDATTDQWNEDAVTFDKAVFYTNDQSSGTVTLVVPANEFSTIGWSNEFKPVIQTDKNWKVAQIRDIATGSPVNSMAWNDVKSFYQAGQGYIDKVPVNVNFGIEQYLVDEFRDKWIASRFMFHDCSRKTVVNLIITNKFQSVR